MSSFNEKSFTCTRCSHLATVHSSHGCVIPGCACSGFIPEAFTPGMQVAYVPGYANAHNFESVVQYGFVVGVGKLPDHHWCRFWSRGAEGRILRTVQNSEQAPDRSLIYCQSCQQEVVDAELAKIAAADVVAWEEV